MDSAATLSGPAMLTPASPTPAIDVGDLVLPARSPRITRADLASLALATALHAAVLAAFLTPERRLGIGGFDANAIGVEIVTLAPAMEARADARIRGAAADREVGDRDGASEPVEEQVAAPDSRRDETPEPNVAAAPPADLALPDWSEPQPRPNAAPTEPLIARYRGEGTAPETPELRPARPEDRPSTALNSLSAADVLARFRGGAAARGKEAADTQSVVMPAARVGLRNAYQIELFKALLASQPVRPPGARGEVKVQFLVMRSGAISEVRVVRSSGDPRLDEAVVAAVRVARAAPPPSGLDDGSLWFDVPYTFK